MKIQQTSFIRRGFLFWTMVFSAFAASTLLGLMVVARLIAIANGVTQDPSSLGSEISSYVKHVALSLFHLIPGLAFLLLGPLQFSRRLRHRFTRYHRVAGVVFVVSGVVVGLTGMIMNALFPPVGGPLKLLGTYIFGGAMIACLVIGTRAILQGDLLCHRAFMMRGYALGLAVGVQRLLIVPVFLIQGEVDDFTIGLLMWLGWVISLAGAEIQLARERGSRFVDMRSFTGCLQAK